MGRGVSYPSGAVVAFDHINCDCVDGCDCFDYYREDIEARAAELWPSLSPVKNKWLGREDHALASNSFAYFGVSEYCGCVAIWLTPRGDLEAWEEGLAMNWIGQARAKLEEAFGTMERLGAGSNGIPFYRLKNS